MVPTSPSGVVMANASGWSINSAVKTFKITGTLWIGGRCTLTAAPHSILFFAKEFLTDIQDGDTTLACICNSGTTVTNTMG